MSVETREPNSDAERRALLAALLLNVGLSAGLLVAGVLASSSALLANALDNASDVAVYSLSLFAATRSVLWKVRAASVSGIALLIVAVGVIIDAVRRFVEGAEPIGFAIVVIAIIAAAINILCLRILSSHRTEDVTLRATWTFSINDLLTNLGALIAGSLVLWLGQAWPDLVIGLLIAVVAAKGGIEILLDARRTRREKSA